MRRRALLRSTALAALTGVAGCGGTNPDNQTDTTTTTTTDTTTTSGGGGGGDTTTTQGQQTTATGRIDASIDELKLRLDALPQDEDWERVGEDEDTTEFEKTIQLTDYKIVASVLAHEDVDQATTVFGDQRDRAEAYNGVTVKDMGLATEAFGYKLTRVEGTIVFRDVNVVGKIRYGIDEYVSPDNVVIGLSEVNEYATRWHDTWR